MCQFTSLLTEHFDLYFVVFPAVQLQNCSQAPKKTGIYNILNHGSGPFPVYCDQTTDGGGMYHTDHELDTSVVFVEVVVLR